MSQNGIPQPQDEAASPINENLVEGCDVVSDLLDIGFPGMFQKGGYNETSIALVADSLEALKTNPTIEVSPYTGEYLSFAKLSTGERCVLHQVRETDWADGGYHFVVLNHDLPEGTLYKDEHTIAEILLLKDKGVEIAPGDVFLDAMYTRCGGDIKWQHKEWLTWVFPHVGKYTHSQWESKTSTIEFKYPAAYPNTDPLTTYEMHLRNFQKSKLNGDYYQTFMRMLRKPEIAAVPHQMGQTTLAEMSKYIKAISGDNFNGQFAS